MKKYIVNLMILFVAYNCCAMELDPFDGMMEQDEKCWWVARYLHKYPKGKNAVEAKKIELFLEDAVSEKVTILPWLVTKYKNQFDTVEGETYLSSMYQNHEYCKGKKEKLSADLREKIFRQALSYSAKEYYVTYHSLQFLNVYQPDNTARYSSCAIKDFCKPHFLAEIDEENEENVYMLFADLDEKCSEDTIVKPILFLSNNPQRRLFYCCKLKFIKELISFLDNKEERVNNFEIMFNNYLEQLVQMDENNGFNVFVFLLERFRGLSKRIIYCYTGRDRLI